MTVRYYVAVDLGASSGRIMLAKYDKVQFKLDLKEVYRFRNDLHQVNYSDCWDIDSLENSLYQGLEKISNMHVIPSSIGIDTWGVDYVLINEQGKRVGSSFSYRDKRTDGIMEIAIEQLGKNNIYRRSGIQFLTFNTIYQFRAFTQNYPELLSSIAHALLIPDYLCFRLTGKLNWEYTNSTTTQMLNINTNDWDPVLLKWSGVPRHWLRKPSSDHKVIGHWKYSKKLNINLPVVSVATHDTASAVVATPLADYDSAYLSSGTWSLIGFESKYFYTSNQALDINVTNEGGTEGLYRVLKNIMGLWLLQRVMQEQQVTDLTHLIAKARLVRSCYFIIDPNDPRFINPNNMTQEIQSACQESSQHIPKNDAELARCIFDSLAILYSKALSKLAILRRRPFNCLHIVGGGCQNELLNQLCADACGIPVLAGPVEASAIGNVGCQLMASGEVKNLNAFRDIVKDNYLSTPFLPNPSSKMSSYNLKYNKKFN